MSLSRVETKKKAEKQKRVGNSKRQRSVWIIIVLLAVLIVVVAAFIKGGDTIGDVRNTVSSWFEALEKPDNTISTPQSGNTPIKVDSIDESTGDSTSVKPSSPDIQVEEEQNKEDDSNQQTELGQNDAPTVTLAFVGDILQGEYINTLLVEQGYNYPYEKALFSLSSADYTIGNLEMPFTENGVPAENKQFVFNGKPEALSGLTYAGFDLVTLANNHTLDQGIDGLYDTMKYLDEHGIHHIGAGRNESEAYTPHIVEINGIKLAFLAASWVLPENEWKATPYAGGLAETYDTTRIVAAIKEAEQLADVVVLYVHWGTEKSNVPEQRHIDASKLYIDAGADLIVGSHAHVLQGFGSYQDKWIAYNLGNFVFSAYPKGTQAETGVLNASCTKEAVCELAFVPMKTEVGQPIPLQESKREAFFANLETISLDGIKVDGQGRIYRP